MTVLPACRRDLTLYIKWSTIFFCNQKDPSGSQSWEFYTQLLTLKESIWYLGETSCACFQAHNIGLSKNVTISPKLGSAELSYGLSWISHKTGLWPAGPVKRYLQYGNEINTGGPCWPIWVLWHKEELWGSSSMSLLIPSCHLLVPLGCELPAEVTRAFELVWYKTQSSNLRMLWWPLASNLQLKISPFLPQ